MTQRVSVKPNVIDNRPDTGLEARPPAAALVITVDEPLEQPVAAQPYDLTQMTSEWAGIPLAELSVLLVNLKLLQVVHQTHHWISRGDNFYGDHLLFDRLYSAVTEEIDAVAEKTVGLGSEKNVDVYMQTKQLGKLVTAKYCPTAIPTPNEHAILSFGLECDFVELVKNVRDLLEAHGELSYGLDNLLAEIADTHEEHKYLLRQRITKDCLR